MVSDQFYFDILYWVSAYISFLTRIVLPKVCKLVR